MRHLTLVSPMVALVLVLCIGVCAFGQDLKSFRMLGNLVPHAGTATERARSSILIYKERGIVFHVSRRFDTISEVVVFRPAALPKAPSSSGTTGDVVPGVGAYGVTLGMSMEQVRASPYLKGARTMMEDSKGAGYDLGGSRIVIVSTRDSKVSELVVYGPLKTVEGITEGSSVAQIQAAYGPPDEYYDIEWRINPHPWSGAALILPMLGLATGLLLRWVRPRVAATPGGVGTMVALGATGLGIAILAYLVVFLFPTGVRVAPAWYRVLSGMLTGGGSVLILELLPLRLRGLIRYVATLLAMLVLALVVDEVVHVLHPVPIGPSAVDYLIMLNGPFIVALFFAAGVRRAE